MIQEDGKDEPIDFSWFYYIGRNKLGLSFKEVGRITLTLFNKLYDHYKYNFFKEMAIYKRGITFAQYEAEARKEAGEEEWF